MEKQGDQSMTRDEALKKLGLADNAGHDEIYQVVEEKLGKLAEMADKAPTEDLKAKYLASRHQLERMRAMLLADADNRVTTPEAEPQPGTQRPSMGARSPLSRTKLADLPSADPRNTRLGDDGRVELNIASGTVLAGRYTVREQIGAGGMGAVFRAEDANTGREIAIKVLLPALLANEKARERFLDEARISQQLSHPQIVNVFDVQQDGDFYFLTMELLEGQDLRQVIENKQTAGQKFEIEEVREILAAVCDGLTYAHQQTVHRDIKPENIWLTENGEYKIMDFGIAQVQSTGQRTKTGAAMGTAYYMAPEQLKGIKDVDGRADQYALAVLAYELLTGEVPAGMIEPVTRHRKDVPRGLADAIHKALAPNRDNRFANIQEFRAAIASNRKGVAIDLSWLRDLPLKHVAAGFAGFLLLGAVAVASMGGDGLKEFWDTIRPYSEDEVLAFNRTAASVEGRAKTADRRLSEYRADIENRLRDNQFSVRQLESELQRASTARRNEIGKKLKELALEEQDLKTQRDLLRDYVVEGDMAGELSGRLGLAKSLLQDGKYHKAMPEFDAVNSGYEKLLGSLEASAPLAHQYNNMRTNKEAWEAARSKYQPGQIAFADEVAGRYDSGHQMLQNVEIVDAVAHFEQLAKDYQRLTTALTDGEKFRTNAGKAKQTWEAYAGQYKLKTSYTDNYANQFAGTEQRWQAGEVVHASEAFEDLHKNYVQLLDAAKNSKAYHARAQAAKAEWEKYAGQNKLSIGLTAEYGKQFQAAEKALANGDLVDSAKQFAELDKNYKSLMATAKIMLSSQYSAIQAGQEWGALVGKGWASAGHEKSAQAMYNQATKEKDAGSWSKATSSFDAAASAYAGINKRAKDNRTVFESTLAKWEGDLTSARSRVESYSSRLSGYYDDLRSYEQDMNRDCYKGSGWGAVASGLSSASCEMGCNRQVYNGYYYTTETDQACVNRCRYQAQSEEQARQRKIDACESEVEDAQDDYYKTQENIESTERDLSSAKSTVGALEQQRPQFRPL